MNIELRRELVDKPLSEQTYHYHHDKAEHSYVGAVWQERPYGGWHVMYCREPGYGPIEAVMYMDSHPDEPGTWRHFLQAEAVLKAKYMKSLRKK